MSEKQLTRKEFLKTGVFGILAMLTLPISRMFRLKEEVPNKEAKYYKELAG